MANDMTHELTGLLYNLLYRNKRQQVPHFVVDDLSYVSPMDLHARGIRAALLDKSAVLDPDHCIPYDHTRDAYSSIVTFLQPRWVTYDQEDKFCPSQRDQFVIPENPKEGDIGVVLDNYRISSPSQIVLVTSKARPYIEFGNHHGMLTIYTKNPSGTENGDANLQRDPFYSQVAEWMKKGIKPPKHKFYHQDIARVA